MASDSPFPSLLPLESADFCSDSLGLASLFELNIPVCERDDFANLCETTSVHAIGAVSSQRKVSFSDPLVTGVATIPAVTLRVPKQSNFQIKAASDSYNRVQTLASNLGLSRIGLKYRFKDSSRKKCVMRSMLRVGENKLFSEC